MQDAPWVPVFNRSMKPETLLCVVDALDLGEKAIEKNPSYFRVLSYEERINFVRYQIYALSY